jgi:hypothetical protein
MTATQFSNFAASRFPGKQDAWLVFSACIFPIHIWITIVFLYNFPSLILKANLLQIMSVLSYSLVFALLESLILFGILVLLAAILPKRLFRERFVILGSLLALVIVGLALLLNTRFMQESTWAWIPVLGFTGAGVYATVRRAVDADRENSLAERFTIIAAIYIILDLLALLFLSGNLILS